MQQQRIQSGDGAARAVGVNEDTELEEELMDEMDNMESDGTNTGSDPRWNALSKLSTDGEYDSDN